MENVYHISLDNESYSVRFRLDELLPVISLLDLLGIDSNKIRDLYYYHREILKESSCHYMEYRYKPKFKKRELKKEKIIEDIGELPLFECDDIF